MIGPGKPVDTDRYFVVSANLLGGCAGTTGPSSIDPATGKPYGLRFPHFTVGDLVEVQRRCYASSASSACTRRSAGRWAGCRSCSGRSIPDEIAAALLVCATSRLSAAEHRLLGGRPRRDHARRELPRRRLLPHRRRPDAGLAVARMIAHITYVSEEGMREKFGRRLRTGARRGRVRRRLPGRELPGPPGRQVPASASTPTATCI